MDEAGGLLYVADQQNHIHMLAVPGGAPRAVWAGSAPISLDATNGRLYVNTPEGVQALDSRTGAVLACYPMRGVPAADPHRDLVYIAQRGVTIFDRSGRQVGRLESTFPSAAPSTQRPGGDVRVNPVNGYVVVSMLQDSHVSALGSASYLRVYPPATDRPIDVPLSFVWNADMTFDPTTGNIYASFGWPGLPTLLMLSPTGQKAAELQGSSFWGLAFDAKANVLYAAGQGTLARLRGDNLALQDLFRGPDEQPADPPVAGLLLNRTTRQLYFRQYDSSNIIVYDLDALQAPDLRPRPADLPDEQVRQIEATTDSRGLLLYTVTDSGLYRSRDGQKWERLLGTVARVSGQLTLAGPGVLFYAAKGIWRSHDGGDNWEMLNAKLTNLDLWQAVQARSADEAYIATPADGILAWSPSENRWRPVGLPVQPSVPNSPPVRVALAPDGTLFATSGSRLLSSKDGGLNWQDVDGLPMSGFILGFAPDYTVSQTVYGLYYQAGFHLLRSRNGGANWESIERGLRLPDYPPLPRLAFQGKMLYLYYNGPTDGQLFRSSDGGDSWEMADPAALKGTTCMAIAPDGRLWFGWGRNGVQSLAATTLTWLQAPPTPTPTPVAREPGPTAMPCKRALTGHQAALAARVPELGCPFTDERLLQVVRQRFEHGQMLSRSDESSIYELYDDGDWLEYVDQWRAGEPESDSSLQPPPGLQRPVRGFGMLWRAQRDTPEGRMGWAIEGPQKVDGSVQWWEGGMVLRFGSEEFILLNNWTWR